MYEYLDLISHVLETGVDEMDRTGTGTRRTFGYSMGFDLSEGFPLVTTKKIHLKSVIHELLWMLSGDTNIKYLKDKGVRIWDEWADKNGDLGRVYGAQWRDYIGINQYKEIVHIDQIANAIHMIKTNPTSRRIIVNAWNPAEVNDMALPPCHSFFQFAVIAGQLHCKLYQRSADVGLGVSFNIAFYSLLTMMVAQVCDLEAGNFLHTLGDAHIYHNHIDALKEQLTREPRPLPTMKINPDVKDIFSFKYEDFELIGYDPHPHIKMEVAV